MCKLWLYSNYLGVLILKHINVHFHINVHRSITHCSPTLVVEELVWVYTVWYGKAYAPSGMRSAH